MVNNWNAIQETRKVIFAITIYKEYRPTIKKETHTHMLCLDVTLVNLGILININQTKWPHTVSFYSHETSITGNSIETDR